MKQRSTEKWNKEVQKNERKKYRKMKERSTEKWNKEVQKNETEIYVKATGTELYREMKQ